MSEMINNREYRQKVLKELIGELHGGKKTEDVKKRFGELIKGISTTEISEMESALIAEGMPVEEIQRLCDVHSAVFKGSIEEIHLERKPSEIPGHPVYTFHKENRAAEDLIGDIKNQLNEFSSDDSKKNAKKLADSFEKLLEIDKHYLRKENLLFPFLEKYEITAPPKVMWGVDDEIRKKIKEVTGLFKSYQGNKENVTSKAEELLDKISEMIYKEENILFPLAMDTLAEDEWMQIQSESKEFGYAFIKPKTKWKPVRTDIEGKVLDKGEEPSNEGYITFDTGIMSTEEINAVLNTLPLDITFVDKDGAVKYFSMGKDRIFARPKTIIGRQVQNCHPPSSIHIVEKIVSDLKNGIKDHEDFWIRMGNRFAFIRYFAVRDEKGKYLGVMEVSQDIKPIQELTGEKRLISE